MGQVEKSDLLHDLDHPRKGRQIISSGALSSTQRLAGSPRDSREKPQSGTYISLDATARAAHDGRLSRATLQPVKEIDTRQEMRYRRAGCRPRPVEVCFLGVAACVVVCSSCMEAENGSKHADSVSVRRGGWTDEARKTRVDRREKTMERITESATVERESGEKEYRRRGLGRRESQKEERCKRDDDRSSSSRSVGQSVGGFGRVAGLEW
jgi:hypothetical protein